MTELAFLPAVALAAKVRSREIGCLELLNHFIARHQKYHTAINAIVFSDIDRARERAEVADRALARGDKVGPLHGVPMTVKECFALEGTPATFGLPRFRNNVAKRNALAVDRVLVAGANIFGKTNVPPWLAEGQSDNEVYGRTNNPWDLARTPGGSSGGAAAAVSAGLSALELGTDISGSVRNPAMFCGLFAHKPTWGICPKRGTSHDDAIAEPDISVVGPIARSADDLEAVLRAVAGPDEMDAVGYRLDLPPPIAERLDDFRVALLLEDPVGEVDESVRAPLERLGTFLERQGTKVVYGARPDIDSQEIFRLFMTLVRAATSTRLTDAEFSDAVGAARTADLAGDDRVAFALRGNTLSHREWHLLNEARHRYRLKWRDFFRDYHLLLCPSFGTPAPRHMKEPVAQRMLTINGRSRRLTNQMFWAGFSGLPYLPSSIAPLGLTAEGLPVGVQIIGPQYHDLTCIHFARLLEQHYRAFTPPPGYSD
jgi:amidase